jgi:hypothetical protein
LKTSNFYELNPLWAMASAKTVRNYQRVSLDRSRSKEIGSVEK